MGKMKDGMKENNPLIQAYLKILPLTLGAIVVIFVIVKLLSGIFAPKELTVDVKFKDFEQGAVMKVPMRAAADEAFTEELELIQERKSGFMNVLDFLNTGEEEESAEAEDGSYTFKFEYKEKPETVYLKTAQWWYPYALEEAMTLPAVAGAQSAEFEEFGAVTVSNVEVIKISTGLFNVNVTLSAAGDAVPTDVKLEMGGYVFDEWDGSTEPVYNEETGFSDRTLVFRYNRNAEDGIDDLMKEAELEIHEFTIHREYVDFEISTGNEGFSMILPES